MRLLSGLSALLSGAVVVLLIAAINGGYVYRTQCAGASGSTETNWTYKINQVIPYIGYSKAGCETHTGTRVALDSLGIWKLHNSTTAVDHTAEYTASDVAQISSGCVGTGAKQSFCDCFARVVARYVSLDDYNTSAAAIRSGDTNMADLPKSMQTATTITQRSCH
jgi:hypothetical protein